MIIREFNLYLNAGRAIPLVINVNQFDSGEQWVFTIYKEDGTQYIPSTGAIIGIKADSLGIINTATVDEQGRVVVTETQQMTAAVGEATFELTLDSGTHGTANFNVLVEAKPGNNADLSDSDLSLIQEALNAVSPLPTGGTVGQVLTKTAQGSAWSDAGTPTQEQVAEAVSDWADENITVTTGVVIDQSLSVQGAAADAKKTGDEISDLKSQVAQSSGVPSEVKQAIATLLNSALYKSDGLTDEKAVIVSWASQITAITINQSSISISGTGTYQLSATTTPSGGTVSWSSSDTSIATVSPTGLVTGVGNGTATITASSGGLSASCTATISGFATLSSISAVFTQAGDIYPWATLDDLKTDLVVTATYSDSSTQVLSDDAYTLSGSLAVGTDTITVSYLDKSATFTVTVTEKWSYSISDLTKVTGTYASHDEADCKMVLNQTGTTNKYRRSFAVGIGGTSVALGGEGTPSNIISQTSNYYPIKVPAGTTSFTVSVTPSSQYIQVLTRQLDDGVYSTYSAPGGSGYIQGSTTRTPASCPDNVYIFVSTKYNSAGTSYPTEPTGLDITFSKGD